MNRLTKDNYDNDVFAYQKQTFIDKDGSRLHRSQYEYNNALWEYVKEQEDIEEELGIDLLTLFKALKNGIYFRNPKNNKINSSLLMWGELEISERGLTMLSMEMDILFDFKDYGKAWALTKEELL